MEKARKREYRRAYYRKNRVRLCRQKLYEYFPRAIREIGMRKGEDVFLLYEKFPFEVYGEPFIRRRLWKMGIAQHRLEYQECYDAASDAYLYSIARCAFCGYGHVEFYIRKMIRIAVIWGLVLFNDGRNLCMENGLAQVELDGLERRDWW